MVVTLWGRQTPGKRTPPAKGQMMRHPLATALAVLPNRSALPRDQARPLVQRLLERRDDTPADPLARTPKQALIEAALMIAEEPVLARKLAQVAGVNGASEARKLVNHLRELLE